MSDKRITQQETYDHIFGVGALTYSWWEGSKRSWKRNDMDEVPDGWTVALIAENPEAEGTVTGLVNHWSLIGAMNAIAHPHEPWGVEAGPATMRECRAFLFDPDHSDFDAGTADCVLQVAVFGSVIFG
ncbi:hypothetical protein GTY75_05215 [Streptomyces sp. SID8381]|uniref:hypothetical protein n=1 Tax=unclassified Streptomyces TaxID=2593676 RepID=UPI0003616533|nr:MULTISPECIES: hypothetical protein [unclassified Streptomyces]MYX26073.1 hypothetical protein [Streptomyces sp. SID8381]